MRRFLNPLRANLNIGSFILLVLLSGTLLTLSCSDDDTPTPQEPVVLTRNIVLTTQSEVQEFANRGVTHLQGNLTIGNVPGEGSLELTRISDLSALSTLEEIDGDLNIFGNGNISNLHGLESLLSVEGDLHIGINEQLEDLDGLSTLEGIGGKVSIVLNRSLVNLNGLDGVSGITSLRVDDNPLITSLFDMRAVSEINELMIDSNPMLVNLEGLSNTSVTSIYIRFNASLENLKGLEGTTALESLTLSWNESLRTAEGLENLESIDNFLILERNDNLENLSDMGVTDNGPVQLFVERNPKLTSLGSFKMRPLQTEEDYQVIIFMNPELTSVEQLSSLIAMQDLYLFDNDQLTNLDGLSNLSRINSLRIQANDALVDLQGLEQLAEVDLLDINLNTQLVSLDGLNGLITVNENLQITTNRKLSNLCALQKLVDEDGVKAGFELSTNAFNPSLEDLKNGNCSN